VYGTLVTDHRPLCKILGEKEGIPPLAAARMQRWVLALSAYQYHIQHTPGKQNHLTDCLSRLPSPHKDRDGAEKVPVVVTDQLPVVASQIAKATERDKVLGTVLKAVQHGLLPSFPISIDEMTFLCLMVAFFGVVGWWFLRFFTHSY